MLLSRDTMGSASQPDPSEEALKDFFISYNKADRGWAEWIAWTLEDKGYSTVIQSWDFRPGNNFALEMKAALSGVRQVIAVLSPNYLSSKFAQAEWAAAFASDPTGSKRFLVPVRVAPVQLSPLDATVIYVDFVGKGEGECESELLRGVQDQVRLKPAAKPAFPGPRPGKPVFPGGPVPRRWPLSTAGIVLALVLLAAIFVYYRVGLRDQGMETGADIKVTRSNSGSPAPAAKPAGTLTLQENHR